MATLTSVEVQRFQPVIDSLQHYTTSSGSDNARIVPIRYIDTPNSHVLLVRIESAQHENRAYIKVYKSPADAPDAVANARNLVAAEFDALREASILFAGSTRHAVVEPIACFPEHCALVTAAAEGVPLSGLLRRPFPWRLSAVRTEWLTNVFERIGGWVKAFQGGSDVIPERLSLSEMYDFFDNRLSLLVESRRFSAAHRLKILSRFEELASQVPASDLIAVPVHADFCPSNVHVSDSKVTVLDPVPGRTESRYHDVAHMFMHLENLKARPWVGGHFIDSLQLTMLQAYDRTADPETPLFQLSFMRNVLGRLVQDETQCSSAAQRIVQTYVRRHNVAKFNAIAMNETHAASSERPQSVGAVR